MQIRRLDTQDAQLLAAAMAVADAPRIVAELVENAIDAGATEIEVGVTNYGLDSIDVADNGSGIPVDGREYVLHTQASGKSMGDTLGFRGEALLAIGLLADVEISTRTAHETLGVRITKAGTTPAAMPVGTRVKVAGIFRNHPVRRREMERCRSKTVQSVVLVCASLALANPQIAFRLTHTTESKKVLLRTAGRASTHFKTLIDTFSSAFGVSQASKLRNIVIDRPLEGIHIEGALSHPPDGFTNTTRLFMCLANRPVELPEIKECIINAYRRNECKLKPFGALSLTLPLGTYDVNVAPDKQTVLFKEETGILRSIREEFQHIFTTAVSQTTSSIIQPSKKAPSTSQDNISTQGFASNLNRFISRDNMDDGKIASPKASNTSQLFQKYVHNEVSQNNTSFIDKYYSRSQNNIANNNTSSNSGINIMSEQPDKAEKIHDQEEIIIEDIPSQSNVKTNSEVNYISENYYNMEEKSSSETIHNYSTDTYGSNSIFNRSIKDQSQISQQYVASFAEPDGFQQSRNKSINMLMKNTENTGYIKKKFVKNINSFQPYIQRPRFDSQQQVNNYINDLIIDNNNTVNEINGDERAQSANDEIIKLLSTVKLRQKLRVLGQFNMTFILVELGGVLFMMDQHATDEAARFEVLCRNIHKYLHKQPLLSPIKLELNPIELMAIREKNLNIFSQLGLDISIKRKKIKGSNNTLLNKYNNSSNNNNQNIENNVASDTDVQVENHEVEVKVDDNIEKEEEEEEGEEEIECYLNSCSIFFDKIIGEPEIHEVLSNIATGIEDLNIDASSPASIGSGAEPKCVRDILASKACKSSVRLGDRLSNTTITNLVRRWAISEFPFFCPHGRPAIRVLSSLSSIETLMTEAQSCK